MAADGAGSAMSGSVGAPNSRLVGVYYKFTPNEGNADLTIRNLGRTIFSKSNCNNADGLQTPSAEAGHLEGDGKVVLGLVEVAFADVILNDQASVTLLFDLG